jgi:hypothetical protein
MKAIFPFGQPVRDLVQKDRDPKRIFILGVYASAVHARWIGSDGRTKIAALAVASEPYIFWRGEASEDIVARVQVPAGVGGLVSAPASMNGPSGRSLDECFLQPMGIMRSEAWLCDIVPRSCLNPRQALAIQREYVPLMGAHGLPEVSLPPVPNPLCDEQRRQEILEELQASKAGLLVLLGDEPIRWFLSHYDRRWRRLGDFGRTPEAYGQKHSVEIAGRKYQVLPLVHPRQASKLGAHSKGWSELHRGWMENSGVRCG